MVNKALDASMQGMVRARWEELVCVTPLGEAAPEKTIKEFAITTLIGSRKRKPLSEILPRADRKGVPDVQ